MRVVVLFVEFILPAMAFFSLGVLTTLAVQKRLRRRDAEVARETERRLRIAAIREAPTAELLEEISTRDTHDLVAGKETRE